MPEYPFKGNLIGTHVAIEPLSPDFARDVPAEVLQRVIEEILTGESIPVLSEREAAASPGTPLLSLGLIALTTDSFHVIGMQLAFYQEVLLARDPSERLLGITWRSSLAVTLVGRPDQVKHVIPQVVDLAGEFVQAWKTNTW